MTMTKLNDLMKKAPDHILRKFTRKCALRHVQKIKPHCIDEDYDLIVKWLETGDESIRQDAYRAADSAADSAVYSAAHSAVYSAAEWAAKWAAESAYWAARSAAELAARSAAKWAAESAHEAADSAAGSAAYSAAYSAAGSARWSETEWQEQTLIKMMDSDDE